MAAKRTTFKQDPQNARRHTERNREMIRDSIAASGFGRPILIANEGTIIAGNATAEAAEAVGLKDVVVIESDGTKLIAIKRTDIEPGSPEFIRLAVADNRSSDLSEWDEDVLQSIMGVIDLNDFFDPGELAFAFDQHDAAFDPESSEDALDDYDDTEDTSDHATAEKGSLLALADVTRAEPSHPVERGETWQVGRHLLVCASVRDDHHLWASELTEGSIFCPYPGPFTPFTKHAARARMVMVQPEPYIAGHILDHYVEAYGEESIANVT